MWKIITFDTKEQRNKWLEKNGCKFQIEEIFINNGYGFEYKKLIKMPHGEVAKKFGCFHDGAGISLRYTYITDEENTITEIIKSDEIGVERDFSEYSESFSI